MTGQSTFVPLFKKGDPTVCANYRTISLISHASKVLLKVILDRMRDKVEFEIAEEQAGFRPNRGTTEHLSNLRIITEKRDRADNRSTYVSSTSRKLLTQSHTKKNCGEAC